MSYPDRNNPYNFDGFLDWRKGFDYYGDDEFLQRVLKRYAGKEFDAVNADLKIFKRVFIQMEGPVGCYIHA